MIRDLVGYGRNPPRVVWPNQARIAVSICVHFQEGSELSPAEGDNDVETGIEGLFVEGIRREINIESIFDYGARRGVWRLLRLLAERNIPATFFCCGQSVLRNPAVARAIAAAGHELAGHGFRWRSSHGSSIDELKTDIALTIEAFEKVTGVRPVGWISRNPDVMSRAALVAVGGFLYDSDDYGDDIPFISSVDGQPHLVLPFTLDVTDEKFWAPPGNAGYVNPENLFHVLRDSFDRLYDEGATTPRMLSISLRPRLAGRPARAEQVRRFLEYASAQPGVWFARREEIARWWIDRVAKDQSR